MKSPALKLIGGFLVFWMAAVPAAGGDAAPSMVDKNLFSADRKPLAPEQPASAPQSNKSSISPKAIQLDGILEYRQVRKALVRFKGQAPEGGKGRAQSPYKTYSEGEMIGEYRLSRIESKSILLEKDGQAFEVSIFADGKVVPPPAPVQAPAYAPGTGAPGADGGQPRGGMVPRPGYPPLPGGTPMPGMQGREPGGVDPNVAVASPVEDHGASPQEVNAEDEAALMEEGSEDEAPMEGNP